MDHPGVLDDAADPAEYHERQGGEDETPVDGDAGFLQPAVDKVDRDDKNNGIRERIDRVIRLAVPDRINVVFVEEFPNHGDRDEPRAFEGIEE